MAIINSKPQNIKDVVDKLISDSRQELWKVNHQIWSDPELGFKEYKAHDTICDFLEAKGFTVTRHAYGIDTAFEARSGSGGRIVNFNAEYDALPNIGHACGHNLIATSSIAAFIALSHVLKVLKIPGRTQLLGTPAEESGGGKVELVKAGAYRDIDASLMAHGASPALLRNNVTTNKNITGIAGVRMVAREQVFCEFHGKSAHAGANPWDGINALDAFVATYNNIAQLRQQVRDTDRIHVAILDAPKVANVIAAYTKVMFTTRSETLNSLKHLTSRVTDCVKAGALATGCKVVMETEPYYADVVLNEPLCDRYRSHSADYGQDVLSSTSEVLTGSSDIGNVSYIIPTLHSMFVIPASEGSSPHHPSFTEAAGTEEANDIALMVGKILALVGWDVLTDDAFFEAAKKDWLKKTADGAEQESQCKMIAGCC